LGRRLVHHENTIVHYDSGCNNPGFGDEKPAPSGNQRVYFVTLLRRRVLGLKYQRCSWLIRFCSITARYCYNGSVCFVLSSMHFQNWINFSVKTF
jgi:hypothetical protein